MPLSKILGEFQADATQCDSLIANAHQTQGGAFLLPLLDRKQVVVAALLNLFVAWESFLEASLAAFMVGKPTMTGKKPVKYVAPLTEEDARAMVIGTQAYFAYSRPDFVKKIVNMYFKGGYPYEPHLSAIMAELGELKTMRNASAHLTSTTRTALESLAQRILGKPSPGIELYSLLTSVDPRSSSGETVFVAYKAKLLVAAELMAKG